MTPTPENVRPITILIAEDDPDDRLLTRRALEMSRVVNDLRFVDDGEELMEYLQRTGRYAEPATAPRPGLVLLDLNMPRKDGREALREIKGNPEFHSIPVVVMTTSKAEEDVLKSYDVGANSYVVKPVTFERLVELMQALGTYWIEFVELPPSKLPG